VFAWLPSKEPPDLEAGVCCDGGGNGNGGVDGEAAARDATAIVEAARWARVRRRRSEGETGGRGHGAAPTGGRQAPHASSLYRPPEWKQNFEPRVQFGEIWMDIPVFIPSEGLAYITQNFSQSILIHINLLRYD
jgi:hypothetical protein